MADNITKQAQETYENLAATTGKTIKTLYNNKTAIGKSGKVAWWGTLSVLVVAILGAVVQNPTLFSGWHGGVLVVVANILLVLINNLRDPKTPNI